MDLGIPSCRHLEVQACTLQLLVQTSPFADSNIYTSQSTIRHHGFLDSCHHCGTTLYLQELPSQGSSLKNTLTSLVPKPPHSLAHPAWSSIAITHSLAHPHLCQVPPYEHMGLWALVISHGCIQTPICASRKEFQRNWVRRQETQGTARPVHWLANYFHTSSPFTILVVLFSHVYSFANHLDAPFPWLCVLP